MAGSSAQDLTQDRVAALRAELGPRFAAHPTVRLAVISVIDAILDGWSSENGMSPESFKRLNDALAFHLEALRSVDPDKAQYTCNQLCLAWDKVRPDLDWL